MEKVLILKKYMGEGVEDTLFPNADNPIEIGAFRYDAKRMGGAPTITASVYYPSCLDDNEWTDNVYAEFNGEKYYLKQTPTSSYDNEDTMYKYDLELVSERVALDNVYFFDVVTDDIVDDDKPVSNSTKVVFFGDVKEFAKRLQASLLYSGLKYDVVVDTDVTSEEKLMSFEDQFFSNVLQEIYNTYEVPYYFNMYVDEWGNRRREIRIGFTNNVIPDTFAYGVDNALLSITKNNANYKIVNRVTGTGSSENLPFYYPNNSPKGEVALGGDSASKYKIVNGEAFANEVELNDVVTYTSAKATVGTKSISFDGNTYDVYSGGEIPIERDTSATWQLWVSFPLNVSSEGRFVIDGGLYFDGSSSGLRYLDHATISEGEATIGLNITEDGVETNSLAIGDYIVTFGFAIPYMGKEKYKLNMSFGVYGTSVWYNRTQKKETSLRKMGLALAYGTAQSGDTITQTVGQYIKTSNVLMPPIYREEGGDERFYNAVDGEYAIPDTNPVRYYKFPNPYVDGKPKEHIITVDDIKPTIKGMKVYGQRIDMFEAFAFDEGDNDETYEGEDGNVYFKHPYFFAKLRPLGFNLFDHAIEQQPMTISFTSGACGACNFEIAVDEDTQKNTVQVDSRGHVVRDENGRVVCGAEGSGQGEVRPQPEQQDTTNHSVWIALRKEESTYGILMPRYGVHEPSTEDTFVILGINLPKEYITNAEEKLKQAIIKYLYENNLEKFNFSISFSRIYFEEHPRMLEMLNENARITIAYGKDENNLDEEGNPKDKLYTLYVSSFSYTMSEGDILPEIRVELDEALTISQNALQNAISQVRGEVGRTFASLDVAALASPYFIRKDADDVARGTIDFVKGIKFGEGGKVEILDNNSAKLTIEYLEVTKKASFTSLEIKEKTHVGGQLLVTPAAVNCGEVEDLGDRYRCYFQTQGTESGEIYNQFAENDQAICQTYNAWGSKYYWRLVVEVGRDYIDLSKEDCDEASGIPETGDKIIQLGNRKDKKRQNAIVLAAYGDSTPYFIQYSGIKDYEITSDNIVTKFSADENIVTGKMKILAGSSGDLNAGGQNLLRNSGFTGDYLSETLADEEVMEEAKKTFSDPLDHWKDDNEEVDAPTDSIGVTVDESLQGISATGVGVYLKATETIQVPMLRQELYYALVAGEEYTLSFKAKGVVVEEIKDEETDEIIETVYNDIHYQIGDQAGTIGLSDSWERYVVTVTPQVTSKVFILSGDDITLCNIQLERGSVATAWNNSYLDNVSDRTYWQSMEYLQAALADYTEIIGGLVLTNQIKLGNHSNDTEFVENAGVSGEYVTNDSPAFWAGGNFDTAVSTIAKYPTSTTTPEGEIPFAVTHGGKVIVNDAVVRGKVYATDGEFKGKVTATSGEFKGTIKAEDGYFSGRMQMPFASLPSSASDFVAEVISTTSSKYAYRLTVDSPSHIRILRDSSTKLVSLNLPNSWDFDGWVLNIYAREKVSKLDSDIEITGNIIMPNSITSEGKMSVAESIKMEYGGYAQFVCVGNQWVYLNPQELSREKYRSADLSETSSNSPFDLTGVISIIAINETSPVWAKLPSKPMDGEEISVYVINPVGITVRGNGKDILSMSDINASSQSGVFSTTSDAKGVFKFVFAATINKWIVTWN